MGKTTKRVSILAVTVALCLAAWIAAGPYLAIHGIRDAMERQDVGKLEKHVDFPALRAQIRAQLEDRLARELGQRMGSSFAGGSAAMVAGMLSDTAVDAMVSPAGIAILLQGHALKQRATGNTVPESGVASAIRPYDPLENARTRFVSPSRFIATVDSADGRPVEFVFERQGLRWRLTGILLPG